MDFSMVENKHILVIDDNPAIHDDFRKILAMERKDSILEKLESELFFEVKSKTEGEAATWYNIDYASQGKEGLDKVIHTQDTHDPYALAFVDIRMPPGWDGIETIERIWKVDPWIQVVICTAYSDYSWDEIVKRLGNKDNLIILKKPFEAVEVRQLAAALVKKWELNKEVRAQIDTLEETVESRTSELEHTVSLVKATLESTADGILVIDEEGKILDFNRKFSDMWNIPKEILDSGLEQKVIELMSRQVINPETFWQKITYIHKNPNLEFFDEINFKDDRCFERYTKPHLLLEKISGRTWSFRDITERKKLQEDLVYEATHDKLTNLPNRALLTDRIKQAIAVAKRDKDLVILLFCDLDRFKLVNDSLGHSSGDYLLKVVGRRLQDFVRESDTVSRLGGDEFVIMLTGFSKLSHAIPSLQKILKVIEKPIQIENHELNVTTSMGVSYYPKDGQDAETLLKTADSAMYRAKAAGKNNYQFYDKEKAGSLMQHLTLENELRHALTNNELFLAYQPIISLTTQKIISFEALIRWKHPRLGLLLPDEFIPIAEESGLIVPLGEWVLRQACLQNKKWLESGYSPGQISVNVSSIQLDKKNFFSIVVDILNETKLDSKFLALEITENAVINNPERILITLKRLKELGVSLVLDDFGTGYSSLSYLKRFPFDKLKIDRSFIKNLTEGLKEKGIVKAIIAMANNLNLKVVAEGAETDENVAFLKETECDEIQGFLLGRPASAEDCSALLRKSKYSNSKEEEQ